METKHAGGAVSGGPVVASPIEARADDRSWMRRHAWPLGGAVAVLTLGGFWWRRRRQRRVQVGPVTAQWLETHEYEAGQAGDEG